MFTGQLSASCLQAAAALLNASTAQYYSCQANCLVCSSCSAWQHTWQPYCHLQPFRPACPISDTGILRQVPSVAWIHCKL